MGMLEESLPKIVKQALKEEDDVTKRLVNVLLQQVYTRQESSTLRQIVINALDGEIQNQLDAGLIDLSILQGE